jgi:hypothetical protein
VNASQTSYPCPCCGYLTSSDPGSYDICPICGWEDDISQLRFPRMAGGANRVSLIDAQANFAAVRQSDPGVLPWVRPAGAQDVRDPLWRPVDLAVDTIEDPIPGRDRGTDYPDDHSDLYYWRPNYWRRRSD